MTVIEEIAAERAQADRLEALERVMEAAREFHDARTAAELISTRAKLYVALSALDKVKAP